MNSSEITKHDTGVKQQKRSFSFDYYRLYSKENKKKKKKNNNNIEDIPD